MNASILYVSTYGLRYIVHGTKKTILRKMMTVRKYGGTVLVYDEHNA